MTVSRQNRGGHQPLCFIGLIGLLFIRGCTSSWYQDSLPEGIVLTTQMKRPNESFKVYQSIWFHGDHWYGLRQPSELDVYMEEGITSNNDLVVFPVSDPAAYLSNIDAIWVPGTTLLVDFPFPNLPNHQDHWAEVMLPYFSVLSNGSWASAVTAAAPSHISAVVVLNLEKKMNDWFSSVLREALRPAVQAVGGAEQAGYTLIDRDMLMGNGNARNWIGFENLVVITDRYTHPDRLRGYAGGDHGDMWKAEGCARYISDTWSPGFLAPTDGQVFRSQAYRRVGLPSPDAWTPGTPPPLPRQITFMFGDEGNTVENRCACELQLQRETELLQPRCPAGRAQYEVMAMLNQLADEVGWRFRTLSLSTMAPIESYVTAMASTGVLIARSSPLLANAIFLPPGAMVLELLPYNWEWKSISQLHFNLTHSVGDIHHFAWRPHRSQWAAYPSKWEQRYATWTVEECSSRECILVHAKAGMLVDVEAVRSALLSKLGRVVQGAAVSELHEPWPTA